MARKIEKIEVIEIQARTSRAYNLIFGINFNADAREFLTKRGHFFGDEKVHMLKHEVPMPKDLFHAEEYQRNNYIAQTMRAVKSDYEDALELNEIIVAKEDSDKILGFQLCSETDVLKDKDGVECPEIPEEPVEDPA